MAKAHSKSGVTVNKATKTERYYTVGYAPHNGKPNPPSAINLKGRWLAGGVRVYDWDADHGDG
nr:SymE family type I addiction module toxin [Pectobacterium parmentieri]